jgi:hypothetical protein
VLRSRGRGPGAEAIDRMAGRERNMRSITLYTDTELAEPVRERFEFVREDLNGEALGEQEYIQYTTPQGNKGITAIERMIEKVAPELNYTLVVEKRDVTTCKYILIELPDEVDEQAYHEYTMHIINGASSLFDADVVVGDVGSLPNETPEQVLSVVITREEDSDE